MKQFAQLNSNCLPTIRDLKHCATSALLPMLCAMPLQTASFRRTRGNSLHDLSELSLQHHNCTVPRTAFGIANTDQLLEVISSSRARAERPARTAS